MRLFDCYKFLLALITFVLLIAHTSFVNSVYQFSKSQALLLSQVRNHSDFLKYFVRKATNGSSHLPIKQGNSEEELAEYAGCEVKEVVVPIPQPASSEQFHWPLCTVARRCSGCCYSRELACLPVQTEIKIVPVLVVRTDGANFDDGGTIEVDIEEHVSCQCQCRLQAQDCNDLTHVFNQSACTCECKRTERCPHRKIWDTKTCSCVCQNTIPCGQGEIFDVENCRCQVDTIFREADRMQHYLQAACRKTCPHSLSLRIPPDSCFCT